MGYKREITDILNDVISSMSFPVIIGNVTATADGYVLECDNIYFAQPGFDVTINGDTYRIIEIDQSAESLTVTGTGTITNGDTFNMYTPYFYHGTPIATGNEIKEKNQLDKMPMLWLWENFTETFFAIESANEREVELEIYALTQANFNDWQTEDAYNNAIKPMKRLVELFVQALIDDTEDFQTDEFEYETENYSKFGVMIRDKGASRNLFVDELSGIGMKFRLLVVKTDVCEPAFVVSPTGRQFDNSFDNSFA